MRLRLSCLSRGLTRICRNTRSPEVQRCKYERSQLVSVTNILISSSPPPSLSPQLHYGVTHPSSGPLFGTVRNVGDPYTANYAVNRPDFNHSYSSSHEGVRYGTQYPIPQTHRPSESYQFTNTNGVYHNSSTMPADTSPRPLSTRQEGPPFEETRVLHPVITSRHQQLMPDIVASIQKGFFQVDQKWTCYRRNYFTVSCSFNLRTSYDGQLYLQRNPSHPIEPILQFAVTISAKTAVMNTNQESESRALVQHTPKRDKATESVPGKVALQPAPPASLSSTGALTNNGNLYPSSQQVPSGMLMDYNPNYPSVQHQTSPTSHTFERIQFQKATANNGKRRAQQQYFHIVVKLSAEVGRAGETSHWIEIATKLSNPMVVRGRSPGHYKDNGRRDSTASMDPDRGAGAGGDSGAGLSSMHTLLGSGRSHSSSMDWEPSHRGSNNMGGGYRRAHESEYSPTSTGTADSASDSPTAFGMGRQQVRSVIPTEYERCGPTTQLHGDPFSSIDMQSEVRRLVPRHCASHSAHQQDFGVYGSQQLDMFASPQPQAICP